MSFRLLVFVAVLSGCTHRLPAAAPPPVAYWSFDGDGHDLGGHGNDANAKGAQFVDGRAGQGLKCGASPVLIADSDELRLAPGLRFECWVKLDTQPPDGQAIVVKDGEYMLRVDPLNEGGHFAFFVFIEGWEPRAKANAPPRLGEWYHLVAGWDGTEVSLEVNGDATRTPRPGTPVPTQNPLRLGLSDGVIDELRVANPNAVRTAATARWSFDGHLRDESGNGHDGAAAGAGFAPGRRGQALQLQAGAAPVQVPNHPDLQLAPGLRLDCSVRFEQAPTDSRTLVIKDGEYQLRVDSQKEGGKFSFFVNLDGGWEPRVSSVERVQPDVWYRIVAKWDGEAATLEVNGERERGVRAGLPRPTDSPLGIGAPGSLVDELRLDNPRLPVLRVRGLAQEHAILRVGRAEKITVMVQNLGTEVGNTVAALELPPGLTCLGAGVQELGSLPPGTTTTVDVTVQADTAFSAAAAVRLTADGIAPVTHRFTLAFLPADDQPVLPRFAVATPGVTYYVDGIGGSNANTGIAPGAAWQDFTHVNGKTLGPGDKLLIRRGSVINQELNLRARGTAENWAEIGAYGTGPRPTIRRNWDIADRCVLVRNPDYLRIGSLIVCYAAKGLVVYYSSGGHAGLIIEDCIAHHIEGLYRPNSHGIPEWRDRNGPGGDGLGSSAGIAIAGAQAKDLVLRNCEMFQCSWGFFAKGEALTIDRVFCHDNYVHNTSPHPALIGARRSFLQNSIFDAAGWHAYAGTMGIMLCDPQGLIIRNCFFLNQPDSGSHDQGGIDFENHGNGCLIDRCTFENNAGAAIEVLGLKVPQPRNVEIANSRFIRNNTAHKLGPSEIFIWGKQLNPEVCCSTGTIHGNGYVLNPGIEFFVNQAPTTTQWTLRNNTSYATVEELEKAMPFNRPPVVDAGPDIRTDSRTVRLAGSVRDDGRPGNSPLAVQWEVLEGPGPVTFQNDSAPETGAEFAAPGDYLLRLVGDDGELWLSDMLAVHILPPGTTTAAAWEFNKPLDKEGWTEVNPGTQVREWKDQKWPCKEDPVKYVAGGYFILAVENTPDAHLLSPDNLGLDLTANIAIRIRFQNHTPATRMRFRFTTATDTAWDEAKSQSFEVTPNDNAPRDYTVAMSATPGWTGRLKQLRLDLATGAPLTGTCRVDYIRIDSR